MTFSQFVSGFVLVSLSSLLDFCLLSSFSFLFLAGDDGGGLGKDGVLECPFSLTYANIVSLDKNFLM